MCNPALAVMGVMMVISAAQTYASLSAQQRQADAQREQQALQAEEYAKANEENNRAAAQEYVNQTAAERIKESQELQATSVQMQEAQRDALEKKGTMLASTNAAGGALNVLLADYDRQEGLAKDNLRHQMQMNTVDHDINVRTSRDRAQNRINSQQSFIGYSVQDPNWGMGMALGIGQGAVKGYSMGSGMSGGFGANLWNKDITPTGK